MSYPSLNARSAALPPVTPPKSRKFLLHVSLSRKSRDHDLPLMTIPDSPLLWDDVQERPSIMAGPEIVSTPQVAIGQRRRSRSSMVSSHRSHGKSASVSLTSSTLSEQYLFRSSSSVANPQFAAGHSRNQRLISPRPTASFHQASSPKPTAPLQAVPQLPADFFNAIFLSQKTVHLPPQPFSANPGSAAPGTLVQLQIVGSTFIIPLATNNRYPSYLARFATGCTALDEAVMESDGTFSEIETDREDLPVSPQASESSEDFNVPSPPSPPLNLRASSMTKLQKLGLLPPQNPSPGFLFDPITPKPDLTMFPNAPNRPPRRPSRTLTRTTIKFLNILLFRSPEPYSAVSYYYSTGELLPSLRTILEGETECKGCPLCGDAERVRKLREVESEAEWLGLEGLTRLCRKERLGLDRVSGSTRPSGTGTVTRKGEGWI